MLRAAPLLILTALAAGCGGSTSAEDQIMATETKAVEALTSDHPERACQYSTDHDGCVKAALTLKALGADAKAVIGIPDDWRERLKKAKVVVNGDTATLSPGPTGKTARFVKRDGHWLAQN